MVALFIIMRSTKGHPHGQPFPIIQKHYEFYLANKISCLFLLCAATMLTIVVATLLSLAIALTLGTNVIAEHGAENEVFFGSELIERAVDHHPDGIETLFLAEKEIEAFIAHGLDDVGDACMFQTGTGIGLIALIESEEHHVADSFLEFVDMVHEHFHVGGQNLGLLHGLLSFSFAFCF